MIYCRVSTDTHCTLKGHRQPLASHTPPPPPHHPPKWKCSGNRPASVVVEKCNAACPIEAGVDGTALTQDGFAEVPSPAVNAVTPKAVDLIHAGCPVETGVAGTLVDVLLPVETQDTGIKLVYIAMSVTVSFIVQYRLFPLFFFSPDTNEHKKTKYLLEQTPQNNNNKTKKDKKEEKGR